MKKKISFTVVTTWNSPLYFMKIISVQMSFKKYIVAVEILIRLFVAEL